MITWDVPLSWYEIKICDVINISHVIANLFLEREMFISLSLSLSLSFSLSLSLLTVLSALKNKKPDWARVTVIGWVDMLA